MIGLSLIAGTVGGGIGELSLAECQTACDLYDGCFGIEVTTQAICALF